MAEHISEDDLLDLAHARRPLGDAPALETHLADCAACSALLCTLIDVPPERRELAGTTLGPYRLDSLIGAGAMGEVYRAWDDRLKRHVAIKVLSKQFAESPERVRRLEAEGRAAAAIAHPNAVTVYDIGSAGDVPYVVTELITGESLRSRIDRGPIPRHTALELARQLARGLAAAHAQGVVHRDLKPSNLIIADDGTLKILDFGLAKLDSDRDVEATEPGTFLGTSGYLAPEQARGEPADPRSDIFAAGAVIYELFAGRRAFDGATFAERISAVLRDTPLAIDDEIAPIVMRCLEKDPRNRFQSAADLAWAFDHDAPRAPPAPRTISRRMFLAGAAATGLGGVVLGRMLAPRPHVSPPEYRQLTFRQGRVASARFTRDGGSLLYSAAWDELALAIYTTRIAGGGTRALELPPAQLLAVSSRGELALALDPYFIDGFYQRGQLALAPLEGGSPRGLGIDVQHADFTPDGSELAIVRRAGGRFRLELPAGRVLLEAGWLANPRVSPDGELVACTLHDGPGDDRGDVVVVPRGGGAAKPIAEDWSSIDAVAWAPDGRSLWISASRTGGNNTVRELALDGRERSSVPSAGRLRVHDVAPDGTLAVSQLTGRVRTMAKSRDGTEIDVALSDVSIVAAISGNGATLVLSEFGDVNTANGAYLRPIAGGSALRLGAAVPFDLDDGDRGVLAMPYAAPDTLVAYPVRNGPPQPIAVSGFVAIRGARWCAGGRIVVAASARGRPVRLWRCESDGRSTPITDEGAIGAGAVSPDGSELAVILGERLTLIEILSGRARLVPGTFTDDTVCGWTAGGVLVHRPAPTRVLRVDAATGSATPMLEIAPPKLGLRGIYAVVATDDAYAYSYGQEQSRLFTVALGA